MNNFFKYNIEYKNGGSLKTATVIFCSTNCINNDYLKNEIGKFYESNFLADDFFVIGGEYQVSELKKVFVDDFEKTFAKIPRKKNTLKKENVHILSFNIKGELKVEKGKKTLLKRYEAILRHTGLQQIFINGGGLVETEGSHHYVFPSGKHCDKFLRTGNILLYSSEIYFIAFCTLQYFNENEHTNIYCDTSSINSIALGLIDLKNRFLEVKLTVNIESFSSYEGLYNNKLNYKPTDFLLISASTSGNILGYIKKQHQQIKDSNILVLYFLDLSDRYSMVKDQVLCNLTESKDNPTGIKAYESFKEDECEFCQLGSYPVLVSGDVFLLERPKINSHLLTIYDPDKNLSNFVEQFKSDKGKNTILKVNYKENSTTNAKYEVFIDYAQILKGFNDGNYQAHKEKLDAYINQYVPSNLKYIIHLSDVCSVDLANYILEKVELNYTEEKKPKKLSIDEFPQVKKNEAGAVLLVSSCISNGKKLLYLCRALRNFDDLRIVYFVGISRLKDKMSYDFLLKNLKQGKYGPESSTFIDVEKIFSVNSSLNSTWVKETIDLEKLINFALDNNLNSELVKTLKKRKQIILNSNSKVQRGLSNDLFFNCHYNSIPLQIRKNFAFFNFDNYVKDVSQSDIYFTINNILNTLRNKEDDKKSLKQTSFERNLLSPLNFNRFNDGIIQASILRSALPQELCYSIDQELSTQMKDILETMVKYSDDNHDQSEALVEFLYALAFGKMTLKKAHFKEVIEWLNDLDYDIIQLFKKYMEEKTLVDLYFEKQEK